MNCSSKRTSGFTLIEIVIVVTVVGLVSMIAVPRIDITQYRVRTGMQGISSELMTARRIAITKQHDVIVSFDVPGQAIYVHDDVDNNGAVDSGERQRRVPLGEAVVFGLGGAAPHVIGPNPVNVSKTVAGRPAITFHRSGSASEGAGFYMTSIRAAGNTGFTEDSRAVQVERATGRVSWYRFAASTWKRGF